MNIQVDQIKIRGVQLDFTLSRVEFYEKYNEYAGQTLVSNEYNQGQVFELVERTDPDNRELFLELTAVEEAENHVNAAYTTAATINLQGLLLVVVIPRACFKFKSLHTIGEDKNIVFIRNIEIPDSITADGTFKAIATIDFATTIDLGNTYPTDEEDVYLRAELKAIPGQIERLKDPRLIGLNIDVIPFMS